MTPEPPYVITDCNSKKPRGPGRPRADPGRILQAADELFASSTPDEVVSLDDVAAAAGVGKGTVFRAFGSRTGLLDALFASRLTALREAIEADHSAAEPRSSPRDQILALLDQVLIFKFENRTLMMAREAADANLLYSPNYVWMHDLLTRLIQDVNLIGGDSGDFAAHMLLGALRVDVLEALLTSGHTTGDIRANMQVLVRRFIA